MERAVIHKRFRYHQGIKRRAKEVAETEVGLVKSHKAKGGASGGEQRGKPPEICQFC